MSDNPYRSLPSVTDVLAAAARLPSAQQHAHDLLVAAIRRELADVRRDLASGADVDGTADAVNVAARALERLGRDLRPRLRPVINATGIVLHTNLGRAPIAAEAAEAARQAAGGYLNLELDLESGKRSSRQSSIREWICRLTGAESATAVNNNAAATVIALRALCAGKEVIISRGQLIEIGGSFRIPEIMAASGATLREVGTTNITRRSDYENAVTPQTAALMRVHSSNYRISGFTKTVPLADLADVARQRGLIMIDDIGSGALLDFSRFGFQEEPVARDSIAGGADLVLFSGDKLLGGPQAGILAGRKNLIQQIEKDPLMRAFRLDKMTLAALEATLRLHVNEAEALERIPILRMLGEPLSRLRERAEKLAMQLRNVSGIAGAKVCEDSAFVGGGSLPDQPMKSCVVEVQAESVDEAELARRLRTGDPALVARVREGKLVLDVRTVFPEQDIALIETIRRAVNLRP